MNLTISLTAHYSLHMLRYLGSGMRDYTARPVMIHGRDRWEFQAVIEGRCAPTFPGHVETLSAQSLWVFPPQSLHGWTGEPNAPCRVQVFHFENVPDPLGSFVLERHGVRVEIDRLERKRIAEMGTDLAREIRHPNALGPLRFQQALLDLSLLVAAHVDPRWLDRYNDRNGQTVFNALAWYDEHMGEAPGVDEMAEAVRVSSSHLRRLFHTVMERSPQEVLKNRQLERARFLLRTTSLTVEDVGRASGFQSLSSFSRSFKKQMGVAPQYWRSSQLAVDRKRTEVGI